MVIRLPSRKRCTSLPSLTARRPKVDSAISAWRQNSVIWLRIWSFFIRPGLGKAGGQRRDCAAVLPSSAQWGNADRLASHMGICLCGDPPGFETNLPELSGRRGDLTAEIEPWLPVARPVRSGIPCWSRTPSTSGINWRRSGRKPVARIIASNFQFFGRKTSPHRRSGDRLRYVS